MRLSRRHFLTAAAGLAASRLWAGSTLTGPGFRLDTLSDGHLVVPPDFLLGDMADAAGYLARHGLPQDRLSPPCNVTLLRDGVRTVLFDVGAGPDFMPTAGKLSEALALLQLAPDEVTHVVFSHGHPDHLWGMLDDFDEPVFPNAEHLFGAVDHAYWTDPATPGTIGEARQTFAVGAARRLQAMAGRLALFQDGQEVLPGVVALMTPGHTPGHMAFLLDGVLIAGDAIGNAHIGFERPLHRVPSDQEPGQGAETRARLLDRAAADRLTLVGFHLPEGGIGQVERAAEGFRFVPA
ncbi:glyoxylase-like metal-dependent hydrolase (beta-lactamase superfamily II) [Cereibacter ovatus]|uniref:Glyoxylase-like metal-dependent hydrolase (Beta-lactamase superfamily II) n=1 Tax=Cereibacter ovatus TaxID=439529 RepID=A0A285CU72_9RHOB|nr:MBL fold metallo-hydrolase [Cereibacter ovatus]SNX71064.1 glyoxylase-like metal-dependent hydrolase (beta-lactamase superfamily II) [Cereibacter ovatus]